MSGLAILTRTASEGVRFGLSLATPSLARRVGVRGFKPGAVVMCGRWHSFVALAATVAVAGVLPVGAAGDEPAPAREANRDAPEETGWQKLFREMAGGYEIVSAGGDAMHKSDLRSSPV